MTKDITPEHTKRGSVDHGYDSNSPLHPEIMAAYDYVDSVSEASIVASDGSRAWHGWAVREAFLAGITYAQSQKLTKEMILKLYDKHYDMHCGGVQIDAFSDDLLKTLANS